jgi:hypothetical protein
VTISARTFTFLAVLFAMEGASHAQLLNCGTISVRHEMRQTPNYRRSVDVTASTSRSANLCLIELQTEVWVDALSSYHDQTPTRPAFPRLARSRHTASGTPARTIG